MTFMNNSGNAVVPVSRAKGLDPKEILVVYDDVDLPFGHLRLRLQGSSGGHLGIQSIIEELGQENIPRLRIGVGPVPEGVDCTDFVLTAFPPAQEDCLGKILDTAADAVELAVRRGITVAMNQVNHRTMNGMNEETTS